MISLAIGILTTIVIGAILFWVLAAVRMRG